MADYKISGGKTLSGKIRVSGSKNALLPILAASVICKDIVILDNVAPLADTYAMVDILKYLNINVIYDNKSKMIIDSRRVTNKKIKRELAKKMRASYYFMGALLSLYNNVEIAYPGGCDFTKRPIDLHIDAFKKFGVEIIDDGAFLMLKKKRKNNSTIVFSKVSVGATINVILASIKTKEKIILVNVAMEPEIDDLINFLNACGINIYRKENQIIIEEFIKIHGANYKIMDDRIEAQTYMVIGALLGKNLEIIYKNKNDIGALLELFNSLGINIVEKGDTYIVNKASYIYGRDLVFDVYPSLPTDIQPILSLLFTQSREESSFIDKVYPDRYSQIEELLSMGYNLRVSDNKLLIRKNNCYFNSLVGCKDLRGGVSLVVAALLSNKVTYIENTYHIQRGYFNLVEKLKSVGAMIEEV